MTKRCLTVTTLVFLLLLSCGPPLASPTVTPTPAATHSDDYQLILDAAWQTVNDKFFDPTFGGKDWQAIGDEYRQKLATVQDGEAFWLQVLNPMLFELGVSHIGALPAELANEMDPITFSTGSFGLDVRLLDGVTVITRVVAGSPTAEAGLRPGFVVTAVNGQTPSEIAAEGLHPPPYNERRQRAQAVGGLYDRLYGEPGTEVVIEYLDAKDRAQRATLELAPREGLTCGETDPGLPPVCAEFQVERLSDGVAYLRFSGFLGPVLDGVLQAIDEVRDVPALIIDLRGNPGGEFPVRKAIASQLVGEPKVFMHYQLRTGAETAYLDAVPDAYPGRVVILVDELSASSSEEFAGSLQALGRATIVGTQTQGNCLVMNVEFLPGDAILIYPYKQPRTPNGRILEDNGVVPDIEVVLDRASLLQGRDLQLGAALAFLDQDASTGD
jgi:carboxyl-terminal processing protease